MQRDNYTIMCEPSYPGLQGCDQQQGSVCADELAEVQPRAVCSLHTSSECLSDTSLGTAQHFLGTEAGTDLLRGNEQEAACRAVSQLGQLPTRLSVSVLGRV